MNWLVYALATAVALAFADVMVKLAAPRISAGMGLLVYGACALLFGCCWVLWERTQGGVQPVKPSGLLLAIGVGVGFTLVTAGIYLTYARHAPVSLASPTIRLGGLLLASLVGIALLKEPLSWRYLFGLMLACTGLYLIITR